MKVTDMLKGKINLKSIRDYILDSSVTEHDSIVLNSQNFDDIVLEHRNTYNEPLPIPFYLLRVRIVEDKSQKTPLNKIEIITNDPERFDRDFDAEYMNELAKLQAPEMQLYRCGRCGNVVNHDGSLFSKEERCKKIDSIYKHEGKIVELPVHGDCCFNGPVELKDSERKLHL